MSTETTPPLTQAAESAVPPRGGLTGFALRCTTLTLLLGAVSGACCAAFARCLELATSLRFDHPTLVFCAPVIGLLSVALYRHKNDGCVKGNALIIERIKQQNGEVPLRIGPLVFLSGTAAHLCGASVGREGAAIQIAAGLAAVLQRIFRLPPPYQLPLLQASVAAGFGAIFGTPFAAAVFALEAPDPTRWRPRQLPLCLLAGFAGEATARICGSHHTAYLILQPHWAQMAQPLPLAGLLCTGVCCGACALLYLRTVDTLRTRLERAGLWWLPPLAVGTALAALAQMEVTSDYLGLGVWSDRPGAVTLSTAFTKEGAHLWSWLGKLVLTAFCISGGFKGGEVTPLFFIGATLGNSIASSLGLDPSTFAALGFATVFSAASHTPVTGMLLGAELFGIEALPLFAVVNLTANRACRGHTLFPSQPKSSP